MSERYTRVAKAVAESAEYTAANTLSESGQEGAMSTNTEFRQSESTGSKVADALIDIMNTAEKNRLAEIERQKNMVRDYRLALVANAAISSI